MVRMNMVLEGEHFVYAANDWRTDNRTSSHHIASRLSERNVILYVEAAGQRSPRASRRDLGRVLSRLQKALRKPSEVQKNVYLVSPLIIPFHRYRWVRRLNQALLRVWVRRACRLVGFRKPIIWMTIPHYAAIMDALPSKGVVYYCTDDFASFPNTDRGAIESMEQQILERADVVFAVSRPLLEAKSRQNPNTFLSPHGVDTAHFGRALTPETAIPEDIANIQRPIAGFFGLVEEWFDLDLLDYCASRLEDVSFVVIGRVTQDIRQISRRPNVHLLGSKPYDLIPNYLSAFSVGLIPFKMNDTILYSNPLKFKEYLAGGKPVVSVRIAAFEKYKHLAYLADSYEEFAKSVRAAIDEDSPRKAQARVGAMAEESWDAKAAAIFATVRERIPR